MLGVFAKFAALLGDAPVIESAGRSHPLETRYLGRKSERAIEDEMASAIRTALAEREGDILAFLPGVREIDRTAERLEGVGAVLHKLHGSLDPAEQRAAIRRDAEGRRKIILATSIAETSLTIDGVRVVVDSGLARRPRHDRAAGVTRLVTERVSAAAATQRAGRAARQGAGTAYRLWEEAAIGGLIAFDPPEILESDLSPLVLDCAIWGEGEPMRLPWLDPPPAAGIAAARDRLARFGALDEAGHVTEHGRAMAVLPLPPDLSHMMLIAATRGEAARAGLSDSLKATMGDSAGERFTAFLRAQVGARSLEAREGDDPDAVLSRAEAALRAGQIETVLAELASLPAEGQAAMKPWIDQAAARQTALDAISALSSALTES